eukprot:SAG11_NODE_143_length_14870_cov_6.472412_11_plen_520_part_01
MYTLNDLDRFAADPSRALTPCQNMNDFSVLSLFGVDGCVAAVELIPCEAIRFGTTLSSMCPLACSVCQDNADLLYNTTSVARRAQVDVQPVAPPLAVSAQFMPWGSTIEIRFDQATNRARMNDGDCAQVLSGVKRSNSDDSIGLEALGSNPRCTWPNDRVLRIDMGTYVRNVVMVVPGDALQFLIGSVLTRSENSRWTPGGITLSKPRLPWVPTAALNAPSVVGACDAVALDATASKVSGGRDLVYEWNVTATPIRDEDGTILFDCADNGVSNEGSTECPNLLDHFFEAEGMCAHYVEAIGLSCVDVFCPTCAFKYACDNFCDFCGQHVDASDDCSSAMAILEDLEDALAATYLQIFETDLDVSCSTNLQGWRWALSTDGSIGPHCREFCGICVGWAETQIATTDHVQSLLIGPRPILLAEDLQVHFEYNFLVSVTNFLAPYEQHNTTLFPRGYGPFEDDHLEHGNATAINFYSIDAATVLKLPIVVPQITVSGAHEMWTQRRQPVEVFVSVTPSSCSTV